MKISDVIWFVAVVIAAVLANAAMASTVVKVSAFGYDAEDSTRFIQAALDSGARRVVFDRQQGPWITLPVVARSNQEIVFEDGVELQAKKGAFKGMRDYLFTLSNVSNVTVRGLGAAGGTLRMHKKDYQKPPYPRSQWRFALRLHSVRNVTVENMSFISSGGDGILVSGSGEGEYCSRNVTIRNCVCDDNHRQGISVISAENLLVENCVFKNTSGTPPQAGVDIEPDNNRQRLVNVVFRHCVTSGNAGKGLELYLQKLDSTSAPVSVLFDRCRSVGDYTSAAVHGGCLRESDFPKGVVEYRNCSLESARGYGLYVSASPASAFDVVFDGCVVSNAARDVRFESAMLRQGIPDGITLKDLTIFQPKDHDWFSVGGLGPGRAPSRIFGNVDVIKPDGRHETVVIDRKWIECHLPEINHGISLPPHVGFLDPKAVEAVDRAPGQAVSVSPVSFAIGVRMLFLMDRPGRAVFAARQVTRRKDCGPDTAYYNVYALKRDGARGRSWRISAVGFDTREFTFDAPTPGFYEFEVGKSDKTRFMLERSSVPVAVCLARRNRTAVSGNGGVPFSLWFDNPGKRRVALVAAGSDYFGFAAAVCDPTGHVRYESDGTDKVFYANLSELETAGLWRVDFSKGKRGVYDWIYIDMYGAPAFFFLTREKTWHFK